MKLTETYKNYHNYSAELDRLEKDFAKQKAELLTLIKQNKDIINLDENQIDINKIELAERLISVSEYTGEGEQKSCIDDAIKQLSTGIPIWQIYGDLWKVAFGTKNYSGWSSQRCDCEYGMCPRHGYINFSIGLTKEARSKNQSDLTGEEIEAIIYYLNNLKKIQEVKNQTKLV